MKIYQGVTLGAKSFELDENGNPVKGVKRHPNIEDDVVIYIKEPRLMKKLPSRSIRASEDALAELRAAFGSDRPVSLCRELTKLHEEILRLTLGEAAARYASAEPRGEYVLVVAGAAQKTEEISLEQALAMVRALCDDGLRTKDAVRQVAEETGVAKNALYAAAVGSKE